MAYHLTLERTIEGIYLIQHYPCPNTIPHPLPDFASVINSVMQLYLGDKSLPLWKEKPTLTGLTKSETEAIDSLWKILEETNDNWDIK